MTVKNHTGITFTLIGILLPFFGSVCLASSGGFNKILSGTIHHSEKAIAFEKQEAPGSKSIVKQDVDFIYRLKNDRFLCRKFPSVNGALVNYAPHPESSLSQFYLVPKPAYYNYLFMFKPF